MVSTLLAMTVQSNVVREYTWQKDKNMLNTSSILPNYVIYNTFDEFYKDYSTYIRNGNLDLIALDTETTGLDTAKDVVVFVSIAWGWENDGAVRALLPMDVVLSSKFSDWVSDSDRTIIFANASYDMHLLYNMGLPELQGVIHDVIIMCHLRDENRFQKSIKAQAPDFLGITMKSFEETFGIKGKSNQETLLLLEAPIEKVAHYATLDAWVTLGLFHKHSEYMLEYPIPTNFGGWDNLWEYYEELEMPLIKTLWCMERRGIRVDPLHIMSLLAPAEEELETLNAEILHLAKKPINARSTKQLSKVFFGPKSEGGMGLKVIKRTEKGGISTDDEVLAKLAKQGVELAEKIIRYREIYKVTSTYLKPLLDKLDNKHRIHTSFLQTGTRTGRLSSRNPNLQNIPTKGEIGSLIRKGFIPLEQDHVLIVADYSQMEMVLMADISKEQTMLDAIGGGLDIHSATASNMMNIPYPLLMGAKLISDSEDGADLATIFQSKGLGLDALEYLQNNPQEIKPLKNARKAAKAIGFGLIYGAGPASLAEDLGVTLKEAKAKIKAFFKAYPSIDRFIKDTHSWLENDPNHTVYTAWGRPRRLHGITSRNRGMSSMCKRQAVNFTVQGSASDIMKIVMNQIHADPILGRNSLIGGKYGCKLLLQVHDEVVLSCKRQYADIVSNRLKEIMLNAVNLSVPLKSTTDVVNSWGEAK